MRTLTINHRLIGAALMAFGLTVIPGADRPAGAQLDTDLILRRVDENLLISTARMQARMIIHYRNGDVREMAFNSWSEGTDRSFLEFTAPARDAGSRFLRIGGDRMWIFLPRIGKSVRIQGHMLRQGLMGSDFSFGDATENPSMVEDYTATLEGEEVFDGRPTYILYLQARRPDLAYPARRIWVDAERWIPLQEERYAKSGKLLKRMILSDVRRIGGRWYPFRLQLNNALQSDTSTTLEIIELELDIPVPAEIFTMRHLEGGG